MAVRLPLLFGSLALSVMASCKAQANPPSAVVETSEGVRNCLTNNPNNPVSLFSCLEKLAAADDASAMNEMGVLYIRGTGTPRNYEKAALYLKSASNLGNVRAFENLGLLHAFGFFVPRNLEEATRLRQISAKMGKRVVYPLWVAGEVKSSDYPQQCGLWKCSPDSESITAKFTVQVDGSVSNCEAIGISESLKTRTCDVIVKRFKYLPQISSQGEVVSAMASQVINWTMPQAINRSSPVSLKSGELRDSDVPAKVRADIHGPVTLQTQVKVDKFGKPVFCRAEGGAAVLNRWACSQIRRGFSFVPARGKDGREVDSDYSGSFVLTFDGEFKSKSNNGPGHLDVGNKISAKNSENMASDSRLTPPVDNDPVMSKAMARCERLSFKAGTPEFRDCTLEQLRLLSR